MKGNPIAETIAQLRDQTAALLDAIDVPKRAERVTAELDARGYGERGPFRHAPREALAEQQRQIHADLDRVAAERLHDIETAVRTSLADLPTIEAHAQQAPTALEVFKRQHANEPYTAGDLIQLQVLEELRLSRYRTEIGRMGPSAVLDLYVGACANGGEEADAIVRFVEERLPRDWSGTAQTADDAVAVQQLARAMREQQERRIPAEVREWRAAVTEARRAVTLARDVHRLQPARPLGPASEAAAAAVDAVRQATLHPGRRRKAS